MRDGTNKYDSPGSQLEMCMDHYKKLLNQRDEDYILCNYDYGSRTPGVYLSTAFTADEAMVAQWLANRTRKVACSRPLQCCHLGIGSLNHD